MRRDSGIEDIGGYAKLMKLAVFQTPQKKYLASMFKTGLPVTPVHTVEELKLFARCVREVGLTDIPRFTQLFNSAVLKMLINDVERMEGMEIEMNSKSVSARRRAASSSSRRGAPLQVTKFKISTKLNLKLTSFFSNHAARHMKNLNAVVTVGARLISPVNPPDALVAALSLVDCAASVLVDES